MHITISPEIKRIADNYGLPHQLGKLIEELDELKKSALAACLDLIIEREVDSGTRAGIIDEMADVLVMVQQIAYLLGAVDEVEQRVEFKIDRQPGRMSKENSNDLP